jgi:hypothetical protein
MLFAHLLWTIYNKNILIHSKNRKGILCKAKIGSRGIAALFYCLGTKTGVGSQRHAQAALPAGKEPIPIVRKAGSAPGPVCTCAENLAPTGIQSPKPSARRESPYRLSYPSPHWYSVLYVVLKRILHILSQFFYIPHFSTRLLFQWFG